MCSIFISIYIIFQTLKNHRPIFKRICRYGRGGGARVQPIRQQMKQSELARCLDGKGYSSHIEVSCAKDPRALQKIAILLLKVVSLVVFIALRRYL